MNHDETDILEQLRNRRKTMLEIFLVALFLGLLLNLFSSALYDLLTNSDGTKLRYPFPYWLAIFLSGTLSILWFFMREREERSLRFNILFPFVNYENAPHIATIPGYAPLKKANSIFSECLQHHPEEKTSILSQLGLSCSRPGPGNQYIFQSCNKVVITLLLKVLKLHCEHTQTHLGSYHRKYEDVQNSLKTEGITISHDEIIGHAISSFPHKILLPEGVSLDISAHTAQHHNRISLHSPYTSLDITILPHWTIVSPQKAMKTYKIATRTLQGHNKVALLSIPIRVSMKVRCRALWKGRVADSYCKWMDFFLNEIRQWLSWEYYQAGDQERLLVEIYKEIKQLGRQKESKDHGQ